MARADGRAAELVRQDTDPVTLPKHDAVATEAHPVDEIVADRYACSVQPVLTQYSLSTHSVLTQYFLDNTKFNM